MKKDGQQIVWCTLQPPPIAHFAYSERATEDLKRENQHRLWIFHDLVMPGMIWMLSSRECKAHETSVSVQGRHTRFAIPKDHFRAWVDVTEDDLFEEMKAWENAGAKVHSDEPSEYLAWDKAWYDAQMKQLVEASR